MSTNEVRSNDATMARVDMKFEIVVIPVSDVDRAKEFYGRLGWRLDADFDNGDDFRVIQFTPPGSGCSVIFGKNVTAAAPGSAQGLYLIVSDIAAARDELVARGVEVERGVPRRRRRVRWHGRALSVWAAPGQRSGSRASQLPLVRLLQRSRRQRLAAAGGHDAVAWDQEANRRQSLVRPGGGALNTIASYESMHMIRKGQIRWLANGDVVGQVRFIHQVYGIAA